MSNIKSRVAVFFAASLALAAVLGSSFGLAAAGPRSALSAGFNLVGGPRNDVAPAHFVSCLGASWRAVYIWDAVNQEWRHYFRTAPAYVNGTNVGGISSIPRFSGVVLIMDNAVASPYLPDSSSDACP